MYYCPPCNKVYGRLNEHSCDNICPFCNVSPRCQLSNSIKCSECNRTFMNETCFENHTKIGSNARNKDRKNTKRSICTIVKVCNDCNKIYDLSRNKHECGKKYCNHCKSRHGLNDLCMMQPIKNLTKKNAHPETCFICYDFETRQDDRLGESTYLHVPNLFVAQLCCDACAHENDLNKLCSFCGVCQHVYMREMTVKIFRICY